MTKEGRPTVVVVKGDIEAAFTAAKSHGVVLRNAHVSRIPGACIAECDTKYEPLVEWFCATKPSDCIEGQGYPDGTLLFYN